VSDHFVIKDPEHVLIGAVGADEGSCTDVGSVKETDHKHDVKNEVARSTALKGAVVEVVEKEADDTLTIEIENASLLVVALAMGATVDGTDIKYSGPAATPAYRKIFVYGQEIEGVAKRGVFKKAYVKPGSSLPLNGTQQTYKLECMLLADPDEPVDEKVYIYTNVSADTTAATMTAAPVQDAAAQARSVHPALTFNEEVNAGDVAARFYCFRTDTGADIPGTLAAGTGNTVFAFTPTSTLPATTLIAYGVSAGVRDLAGNASLAKHVTFTTAA
jgi:hypothetical protein